MTLEWITESIIYYPVSHFTFPSIISLFFFPNFFNIFRIYFLNFFGAGWTVSEGNGLNNRCDSRHGNWIETWMQYATATGATVAALMTLRGSRNRRGKHLIVKHRQHPRQKNQDYKMKSLIWFNVDWTGRRQGAPVPIQIEPNQFDNNRNISEFDFDGRRDKGNCRNSTPPPPVEFLHETRRLSIADCRIDCYEIPQIVTKRSVRQFPAGKSMEI